MERLDCNELALKKVNITGDIIGKFGTFKFEQTFINNTNKILEVGYTFPIVETAAVTGFEVFVGDKHLKGVCKETKKAKKEYAENIVKGNSAYLLEEESDNIFAINIGKIDRDEEVKIVITYIDKFEIIDNQINVLIPTLVKPRYNSEVTEKLQYGKTEYTVDFLLNISDTLNVESIYSPSHTIQVNTEYTKVKVGNELLSKDFKLYIKLKNELNSSALTCKSKDNKDLLYLSFMPEIEDVYEDNEKEYIFIVDISYSMEGENLEETKRAVIECLKQLDEGDKFNIIPFESDYTVMSKKSLEYNDKNLNRAIKYINNLEATGCTEILEPIKYALQGDNEDKVVLLFTDGQVGNEDEIIRYVDNKIGRGRLFAFGIDTGVNAYFIKALSNAGNGKAELIFPNERIDEKVIRTFARIQTPLLENLDINYGKNKLDDEIREGKTLFNYEFYNAFAVVDSLNDDIKLHGSILDNEYSWIINRNNIKETTADLELIYAKLQIDRLNEYIRNTDDEEKQDVYKDMIIEISEKYNINSEYTSFITINERENKILEIPKYQETVLELEHSHVHYGNVCFGEIDGIMFDAGAPEDGIMIEDLELSENAYNSLKRMSIGSLSELLSEGEIDSYYVKFLEKNEQSILTYLLFALYYSTAIYEKEIFDWDMFYKFLSEKSDELEENELYQQILYNICIEKEEVYDFLTLEYKMARAEDKEIEIDLPVGSEEEINEIKKNGIIEENIDKILWYHC